MKTDFFYRTRMLFEIALATIASHCIAAMPDLALVGYWQRMELAGPTHVRIAGTYAYLSTRASGMKVIDISDPKNPVLVGELDTPGITESITISGNCAYLAEGDDGLAIVDVADPTRPQLIGRSPTYGYASDVAVRGTFAYVADGLRGIWVFDVADPNRPQRIRGYSGVTKTTGRMGAVNSIHINDNVLYATHKHGVNIFKVRPQGRLELIGVFDTLGEVEHPTGIVVQGSYAYVSATTEGETGGEEFMVLNVSEPNNPKKVGGYDSSSSWISKRTR